MTSVAENPKAETTPASLTPLTRAPEPIATEADAPVDAEQTKANPAAEFLARAGLVAKLEPLKTLNKEFQTDHPHFDDLFKIIEADPVLLKRFLKFANGGWYNSRIQVDSPYMTFTRFGTEGFYKIALASFLSHGIGELQSRFKLWPHLETVARVGERVAAQLAPKSAEDIFSAGLLHDAVVAPMERELTDYLYFLECAMNMDPLVTNLENNCHNFDHAEAAGELAKELAFAPRVVEAVANHHKETLAVVTKPESKTVLSLLLITKRILWLLRTEKRKAFETVNEKALLTEIAAALDASTGRVQSTISDILEDLKSRA